MRALPGSASHFCQVVVLKLTDRYSSQFNNYPSDPPWRASDVQTWGRITNAHPSADPQEPGLRRADGASSSLLLSSLELSDTSIHEPQTRARLGTTSHFCKVVVLKLWFRGGLVFEAHRLLYPQIHKNLGSDGQTEVLGPYGRTCEPTCHF